MHKKPNSSRRAFLSKSVKASALLPFVGSPLLASCDTSKAALPTIKKEGPLKILILGGTSFLGPHQIKYALERGHQITTFTRGKTKPTVHTELFDQIEMLVGDRNDNLEALKNREWDAVIDNSGRQVAWTKATAELLKDKVRLYLYTSTVSVYYPYYTTNLKEDKELVLAIPKDIEEQEQRYYDYGVMKANSELAASSVFGKDRTIVVRPTFMTGPADRTDRFMYWPTRLAKGGNIILPGNPQSLIQYIDVRDIAEWMIRLLEKGTTGTFNGVGPASDMTLPAYVYGAHAAFGTKVNFIPVENLTFLKENSLFFLAPWVLPGEKFKGMSRVNIDKSVVNGLTYRPLATTIKDTHDWWYSNAVTQERRDKFEQSEKGSIRQVESVLKAWSSRG